MKVFYVALVALVYPLASASLRGEQLGVLNHHYDGRILALSQQCLADDAQVDANPTIVDIFESVQSTYLTDICTPTGDGVFCDEDIPAAIITELQGACESSEVGGQYIGILDFKAECVTNSPVCVELGAICSVFSGDVLSCTFVPGCTWNSNNACVSAPSTSECGVKSYTVETREKPYCQGEACECNEKASSLINDYMARLEEAVEESSGVGVTCTNSYTTTTCSTPTPTPNNPCFSGRTVVEVRDRPDRLIPMESLQIGDHVRVRDKDDGSGQHRYSLVYSFGHLDRTAPAEYLQIHVHQQGASTQNHNQNKMHPLEIAPDHMLYVNTSSHQIKFLPAKDVRVGDRLVAPDAATVVVTAIRTVQRRGVYAPLTVDGDLAVSGVVASSYVTVQELQPLFSYEQQHRLQHAAFAWPRLACRWTPQWCRTETYNAETGLSDRTFGPWQDLLQWLGGGTQAKNNNNNNVPLILFLYLVALPGHALLLGLEKVVVGVSMIHLAVLLVGGWVWMSMRGRGRYGKRKNHKTSSGASQNVAHQD